MLIMMEPLKVLVFWFASAATVCFPVSVFCISACECGMRVGLKKCLLSHLNSNTCN